MAEQASLAPAPERLVPRRGGELTRLLLRNRLAVTGACLLAVVLACALFAPVLAPQDRSQRGAP